MSALRYLMFFAILVSSSVHSQEGPPPLETPKRATPSCGLATEYPTQIEAASAGRATISSVISLLAMGCTYTILHRYMGWYMDAAIQDDAARFGLSSTDSAVYWSTFARKMLLPLASCIEHNSIDAYKSDATWYQKSLGDVTISGAIPISGIISYALSYAGLKKLCQYFEIADYSPQYQRASEPLDEIRDQYQTQITAEDLATNIAEQFDTETDTTPAVQETQE